MCQTLLELHHMSPWLSSPRAHGFESGRQLCSIGRLGPAERMLDLVTASQIAHRRVPSGPTDRTPRRLPFPRAEA
jgi:hypothetical protein